MIKVKIPLDSDDQLTTYSLMEKLGITREEANAILWNLFDIGSVDLIPILNEEKALWGEIRYYPLFYCPLSPQGGFNSRHLYFHLSR